MVDVGRSINILAALLPVPVRGEACRVENQSQSVTAGVARKRLPAKPFRAISDLPFMAAIAAPAIRHIFTHDAPAQHDFTAIGTVNEVWAWHAVDDVDARLGPAAWTNVSANRLFSC